MNTKKLLFFLVFLLPMTVFAGEIFGTLKKDGKPLAKQEVKITQNGSVLATTMTDENGFFSMTIKQVGQVKLEVTGYEGAVLSVFSTNNSSDFTLSLIKAGDKWELKKL